MEPSDNERSNSFRKKIQKKRVRLLHSAPCASRRTQLNKTKLVSPSVEYKPTSDEHLRKSVNFKNVNEDSVRKGLSSRSQSSMSGKSDFSPRPCCLSLSPRQPCGLRSQTVNDSNNFLSVAHKNGETVLTIKDSSGVSRSLTWDTKGYNDGTSIEDLKEMFQQRNQKRISRTERKRSVGVHGTCVKHGNGKKDSAPGKALQRFRTAGIVVRIVIRWFNAIIENSYSKTPRTAAEHQYYTLYTSLEAQKLAFNKNLFVREQAFARVPKWAIDILGIEPQDRTETECRRVHALLRGLKSFDKFTEQIQLSMCKSFSYQRVRSGRVILRRGHVGFNYYFIFSGSVFVNIEDVNIDGNKFDRTVSVLVRGDAFGELALLQNIRRTASITVRENCELLYVDKDTFAKVCPQIFEKEMEDKEHFLTNLRVFRNEFWTKDMLKNLCADSQIQQYKTNKVVCVDSEDEEWIYICMSGKCSVIRRLELDKTNEVRKKERHSTPMLSDEIIDIITSINQLEEDQEEEELDSSDEEATKERMLESMALDYRRDGKRKKMDEKADDNKEVEMKKLMSLSGPTTLTSLMTQDTKSKDGKDYVYVHIGELKKNEIFNFYAILYPSRAPPHSSVILVSTGAQLMRIRRKVFFKTATKDALSIAGNIARLERFVTDEQLLEAYKEMASWNEFKYKMVKRALGPEKENGGKNKLSDAQVKLVHDRRERSRKLLKTLQKNHLIAKRIEEKEEQDEKDKRNKMLENLRLKQKILTGQQHHQLIKIVRQDKNDMVIGRRRNVSSSVTSDLIVKPVLQEIRETPDFSFQPKRRMSRRYSQTTSFGACLPKRSEKPIPKNLALDYK